MALAVFVAVLAEIVDRRLPLLEILCSGRRPFIVADSAPALRDRIGDRCGLACRVVGRELAGLEARGFLRLGKFPNRRVRLELQPVAFGWPADDFERRRMALERRLERRYAPVPLAVIGRYTPAETATLVRIIAAAGVGLFERAIAGERIVVHVSEQDLAAETDVSARTVRRALDRLEADGLVTRTNLGREGIAVELRHALLNQPAQTSVDADQLRTFPTKDSANEDISDAALMHARSVFSEKEENLSKVAVPGLDRLAYWALYGALARLAAVNGTTTPSHRARARRAALVLALASADTGRVAAIGAAVSRLGESFSFERIVDRALMELRTVKERCASEAQFEAQTSVNSECSLCHGLKYVLADGVTVGCPHDLDRVRDWAVSRGWSLVNSPSGQVILECADSAIVLDETIAKTTDEDAVQPDLEDFGQDGERRAIQAGGARLLLDVLARRRDRLEETNSA